MNRGSEERAGMERMVSVSTIHEGWGERKWREYNCGIQTADRMKAG